MTMKRLISWIICLALVFSNVSVFASSQSTEESGVSIVSTTPEDGSLGIAPMGSKMEVTFNVPMDPASLTTATITSEPNCISAVAINEKSPDRCTVYFKALELDTKYDITFSKQVKAATGERLTKTTVSFRTNAEYPKHHQIVNGDMEDTTHLNMFEIGNASASAVSYVKEDGNTVLKFNPQWAGAPVGQSVYLEPGKTYEMRAKIKSSTSQMIRMIMSYVSAAEGESNWWHPIVSKTPAADEWVEYSGSVTIPADLSYDHVRQVRITCANKNEAIYIDDWQFFETGYDVPIPTVSTTVEKKTETYVALDIDTALETLVGMEIFDESVLSKKDSPVSRLDAAVAFAKFMNKPLNDKAESKYADLAGVKNSKTVNALVEMGIMSGFGESFYPNNDISYNDIVKALAKILGYGIMLDNDGYEYTERTIGLSEGVYDTTGAISYSNFAKIILNAADANVLVSKGDDKYLISDRKAMDLILGIYEGKGIVSATEYSDLYGTQNTREGYINIGSEQYKVTCDTYGWEGKLIDYYYKLENDEKIIVYVGGLNSLSRCLTIDYDDLMEYSSNKYTYYNSSDKLRTAKVAVDKKLIYNGKALSSYTASDMIPSYGSVQLIDNNNDGVYDIIRVENLDTYVVHAVDYDNYKIHDEYEHTTKYLDLDSCDKIVVEENGVVSKFENITVGSVVSAAVSKDKSFAKLYVSKNSLEGLVGKISGTSEVIVSIYDEIHKEGVSESFKLHPFYKGAEKARTDRRDFLGRNASVLFDYRGCAVAVTIEVGSGWKWAYLIKAVYTEDVEDEVSFKIFSEDGKHLKCYAAPVVRINGVPKKIERVVDALDNGKAQIIRMQYNSDGKVCEIITAGSDLNAMKKVTGTDYTYFSGLGTLGYKVALSSKSIPVFSVPSNVAGAEDYQYSYSTASAYLVNEKKYTFEAYSCDDNDLNVECIVLKDRVTRNIDSWNTGVITEIISELDQYEDEYTKVTIQNAGSKYTAKIYDGRVDLDNLDGAAVGGGLEAEVGDVVIYQNDTYGYVNTMKLLYKADTTGDANATGEWYTSSNPSSTGGASYRFVAGKVTLNDNGYIQVLPHGAEDIEGNYEVFDAKLYSKILYVEGADSGMVTTAQFTDIYDELCGSNGVNVVIVSAWGAATLMVIYP